MWHVGDATVYSMLGVLLCVACWGCSCVQTPNQVGGSDGDGMKCGGTLGYKQFEATPWCRASSAQLTCRVVWQSCQSTRRAAWQWSSRVQSQPESMIGRHGRAPAQWEETHYETTASFLERTSHMEDLLACMLSLNKFHCDVPEACGPVVPLPPNDFSTDNHGCLK